MEASKKYTEANPNQFISFTDGQEHKVKLLKDKLHQMSDMNKPGQMVEGVKFLVEVDGAQKSFFTTSSTLIQKLAEYKEGSEVVIKQVKKMSVGGMRTSYAVRGVGEQMSTDMEDYSEEEIAAVGINPEW